MKDADSFYMGKALALAVKARGETSPNPQVGALVVKAGRVIGQGYHRRAGTDHAEVVALRQAGARAQGAVLYVTLEPCAHYGRTPPCVERVIASGVRQVVIAMRDPNPLTNGRGIRLLKKHGIAVRVGVCQEQARSINLPFIKYITTGLPYITVKIAQSLDGKIASRTRHSQWITSAFSRASAHRRRACFDAIMVGAGTVLADDPRLEASAGRQPVKVVVDTRLRTPSGARLFRHRARVVILTAARRQKQYSASTAIIRTGLKNGQVDIRDGLKQLAAQGITNLLVEGGSALNGSLFDAHLVDALMIFISPKIIGGADAVSAVAGRGADRVNHAPFLTDVELRRSGQDVLIEGQVQYVHRDR